MAVAKSTIISLSQTTDGDIIKWSSIASGANNTYFDANGKDVSKMILLVACRVSTNLTATSTGGNFYLGASASASSGSCWEATYVGRGTGWARQKLKVKFPSTDAKEALITSASATPLAIMAFGPFDGTRFKDSDGYIKLCKAKGAEDAGLEKVAAIFVP